MPAPRASIPALQVRLLGGFEARRGEEQLEGFESKKVRALFAYLLLNREPPVLRERIGGMLWPEHSEEAARQNLRQAIYNLRSTLESGGPRNPPPVIVASQLHLQIDPALPLWLDVAAFEAAAASGLEGRGDGACEALREAGRLYRGDLLAGFYVKESDLFEDWLAAERERLRDTAAKATRALLVYHESRGEWDEGIRAARRLIQIDPLSEEAYRLLMRCFAFSGRRARALAVFEELEKLLDAELGIEPSPETAQFHHALLAQEAAGEDPDRSADPPGPFIPLEGREAAMAQLERIWWDVRRNQARLTLVEGERGSGKTRLLRTFVHRAASESSAVVLQSRCGEMPRHGLEPLFDALDSLPAESAAEDGPAPEPMAPRSGVAAIAQRLRALSHSASSAARPVLVLIDDLERAGRPTVDGLRALMPLLADRPVWILATARREEIDSDHPLAAALPELESLPGLARLRLEPLDGWAPGRIAQALVGEGAAAQRLADLLAPAGALPLSLAEGVNLLADEGTLALRPEGGWTVAEDRRKTPLARTLKEVVLRRVALLPTTSRRLLALAAVIGDAFDSELLQIADHEHAAVIEAGLEILIARWFIRPAQRSWLDRRQRDLVLWSGGARRGGFEFAQRTVRTILYHHIDLPRRRNMHRRVALAMEQLHAGAPAAVAGLVGHHFAQAGDWPQAAPHLRLAGDQAAAAGDPDLAARHWGRALQALQHLEKTGTFSVSPALERLRDQLEAALAGLAPQRARAR